MAADVLDCLIVGGGAAGLTAAVYLGRYRRHALVVDAGASRLAMIPRTNNVPGFPQGIRGRELLDRMREHVERFKVPVEVGSVDRIEGADGGFTVHAGPRLWRARKLLLATGARDVEPQIVGMGPALASGQVRYCPVCDGYETQGQHVAVLGEAQHGLQEALFVAEFGNRVTWLAMGSQQRVKGDGLERLRERGIRIAESPPREIRCIPGGPVQVELEDGQRLDFDVIYPALGLQHQSQLATSLGARVRQDGQLEVDEHMQTTVPGLYAAGDVAVDLNQISVAAGHAAIAATAIHNSL